MFAELLPTIALQGVFFLPVVSHSDSFPFLMLHPSPYALTRLFNFPISSPLLDSLASRYEELHISIAMETIR